MALVILGVVAIVAVSADEDPPALEPGEVRPDRMNTVRSYDGDVIVEIPGDSIAGPGHLTIEPVKDAEGREGYAIELTDTELVGEATIRFAMLDLAAGEPPPLVTSTQRLEGRHRIARDVRVEEGRVVVRTDHFSNWFVDQWGTLLDSTKNWMSDRLDDAASISPDRAPRCEGEQAVRAEGYDVASDAGRRVYWCLGLEGGAPTLKLVNARGYGVLTEYTPGLEVTTREAGGLVDIVAELLTPRPTLEANTTSLLGSGKRLELAVDPSVELSAIQLLPDPGAYLLSALQFGVETYTMIMERVSVQGTTEKLLTVLRGEQCLVAFSELATTELTTPQEAQEFFGTALEMAFDCIALSAEQIDLGGINNVIVAPMLWLLSGVKTAADGLVAAADTGFDTDGYQIQVSHEIAPAITEESVGELLIPAGTCGDADTFGWDQFDPIQLSNGVGESFDAPGEGAGILETRLVGAVDVTGDGVDEAVLALTCTGSPRELCCAGRTSLMVYVAVLDLTGETPTRVGNTIIPKDVPGPTPYDEVRSFQGDEVSLDGQTVVTYQRLVYPDQLGPADVAELEGEVRYDLQGDQWVASP
jgi:hypothetical protein